jgi:hypothetical protein
MSYPTPSEWTIALYYAPEGWSSSGEDSALDSLLYLMLSWVTLESHRPRTHTMLGFIRTHAAAFGDRSQNTS